MATINIYVSIPDRIRTRNVIAVILHNDFEFSAKPVMYWFYNDLYFQIGNLYQKFIVQHNTII